MLWVFFSIEVCDDAEGGGDAKAVCATRNPKFFNASLF
jgi:hypothetical protein